MVGRPESRANRAFLFAAFDPVARSQTANGPVRTVTIGAQRIVCGVYKAIPALSLGRDDVASSQAKKARENSREHVTRSGHVLEHGHVLSRSWPGEPA